MRRFLKLSTLQILRLAPVFAGALFPGIAVASAWGIAPTFDTSVTLADNITNAARGNEEAELVLSLKPGIQVAREEGRTQVRVSYGLENLYFQRNPDANASRHVLRGSGDMEIFRDLFFINATGTMARQAVTPSAAGTFIGSVELAQDTTQVDTWSFSPRLEHTFGGTMKMQSGINLVRIDYDRILPDSDLREYFFNAASGPGATDLVWSLDARQNETLYEGQLSDNRRKSAELNVKYKVLPQWAMTGRLGYVDFQYDYDPVVSEEPTGSIWRVGVAWIPSARTNFEVGRSKNFFDRTAYAVLNHTDRRLRMSANYDEVVTTRRQLQIDYSKAQTTNPPDPSLAIDPVPYLTELEDVFISKSARLACAYKTEEFSANISGYRDRRSYQNTGDSETVAGGAAAVGFNLSRQATLEATVSQSTIDSSASQRTVISLASAGIRRNFGKNFEGSANLRRNEQKSTDPLLIDYVAHFLTFSMRVLF